MNQLKINGTAKSGSVGLLVSDGPDVELYRTLEVDIVRPAPTSLPDKVPSTLVLEQLRQMPRLNKAKKNTKKNSKKSAVPARKSFGSGRVRPPRKKAPLRLLSLPNR